MTGQEILSMNLYQYSYKKRRMSMVSTCLIFLLACSSLGSEDDSAIPQFTSDYVPAELWLENGKQLISQKEAGANQSVIFAELSDDAVEIEITLDSEKEVSKVVTPLKNGLIKNLYFDYGRLCFSQVIEESGETIVSAYVDSRPYAHAMADGSEPIPARIRDITLKEETLSSIVSLALSLSNREKKATNEVRIIENERLITDTVDVENDFIATMNMQKGKKVDIQLISDEPHIYFTLAPGIGSDMEYKSWSGAASFTGDMEIRVFAAEDIEDGRFRLSVKKY
jgi:hypothetical protein